MYILNFLLTDPAGPVSPVSCPPAELMYCYLHSAPAVRELWIWLLEQCTGVRKAGLHGQLLAELMYCYLHSAPAVSELWIWFLEQCTGAR